MDTLADADAEWLGRVISSYGMGRFKGKNVTLLDAAFRSSGRNAAAGAGRLAKAGGLIGFLAGVVVGMAICKVVEATGLREGMKSALPNSDAPKDELYQSMMTAP